MKKLGKVLLIVSVCVLAVYAVARIAWRYSGSNRWELVAEKNGAKVYGLKEPGSDLTLYKGSVRVRSTMAGAVAWLEAADTCKDVGCYEPKDVQNDDPQMSYAYMRIDMPKPFRPRDFVLRTAFHQIPHTKELWAYFIAAPEKVPNNDCCFRVTNMSNVWRVTPVGPRQLEMEYTMNMDWGGFFPDVLSNVVRPKYMMKQLLEMQHYLDKDKYQNAKYDFIQEPDAAAIAACAKPNTGAPAVTGQ